MAQITVNPKLDAGDVFPKLTLNLVDGGTLTLPDYNWTLMVFYRGLFCPVCHRQLADFQRHLPDYQEQGINIAAASTEDVDMAREMREKHNITFPFGYGLDVIDIATRFGAFYDKDKKFLHATTFIIKPDGNILNAVYATGSTGRYFAMDTLKHIEVLRKKYNL